MAFRDEDGGTAMETSRTVMVLIKKLKSKTKYYVQIRTYKKVSKSTSGTLKYYSVWSRDNERKDLRFKAKVKEGGFRT